MTNGSPDFKEFAALVASEFNQAPEAIRRATTTIHVDGWDSVSHTRLMIAIEDAYGIIFDDVDFVGLDSVGEIFDKVVELRSLSDVTSLRQVPPDGPPHL